MSTGEFARRSRLSPKALPLYDELGLLPPTRVDDDSEYRYYAESQLDRAEPAPTLGFMRWRNFGFMDHRVADRALVPIYGEVGVRRTAGCFAPNGSGFVPVG
jgi:hypothetical protein